MEDGENYSIGNSWIRPSKATTDNEDGDDNVADFFFEDDSATDSTNSKEKDDTPIHFDVGIDGRMMETGPLSLKMYQAIQSRSSMVAKNNNNNNNNDPILTRTMKLPGLVTVPFKPNVQFASYMLRSQLAPRDTHATFFISCVRSAFKSL